MATSSSSAEKKSSNNNSDMTKPRLLLLHGKYQSGSTFSNKIAGARRKLARIYDLDFLDGPIRLNADVPEEEEPPAFGWWNKDEEGVHTLVHEGLEYVLQHIQKEQSTAPYVGIIGFSQGGVVATALACSGQIPTLKAIVTAGSPMVEEAFVQADAMNSSAKSDVDFDGYNEIPKLHLAGETDSMISVQSTTELCQRGGNGSLIVHDQGHLFPTRSARVQEILDFLQQHILLPQLNDDDENNNKPDVEAVVAPQAKEK